MHNETLSVVAVRISNPDCSASLAYTDRPRIVFDCQTANDLTSISSTISVQIYDAGIYDSAS